MENAKRGNAGIHKACEAKPCIHRVVANTAAFQFGEAFMENPKSLKGLHRSANFQIHSTLRFLQELYEKAPSGVWGIYTPAALISFTWPCSIRTTRAGYF